MGLGFQSISGQGQITDNRERIKGVNEAETGKFQTFLQKDQLFDLLKVSVE